MALPRVLLVTVLSAVAVAGCGGGRDADGRAAPGPPPPSKSAAPSMSPEPSASPSPSPAPAAEPSPPSEVVTGYSVFASPTGNIVCGLDEESGTVRCDIADRGWDAPPKPSDCELDWGSGLVLGEDGVDFVCAGDAVGEPDRTLEYGESVRSGAVVCSSAETGVTCEHRGTQHGFTLSRARYTVF